MAAQGSLAVWRAVFAGLGVFMVATLVYTCATDGSPFRPELLTPWVPRLFFLDPQMVFQSDGNRPTGKDCSGFASFREIQQIFVGFVNHGRKALQFCPQDLLYAQSSRLPFLFTVFFLYA
jgi:hypothetical protein